MRAEFQKVTEEFVRHSPESALLLGDIGVFGFRQLIADHPERAMNVGILEQAMVSFAAGLSSRGISPILHTITPFLVERCLEQIKVDFGYQQLSGTFVSVGASFDYSRLGATHHCPADLALFASIPGARVWTPSSSEELRTVLTHAYSSKTLDYVRLSSMEADLDFSVLNNPLAGIQFLQTGNGPLVLAIGSALRHMAPIASDLGLRLAYVTRVAPFPFDQLAEHVDGEGLIIVEPGYEGSTLFAEPRLASLGKVHSLGVPRNFIRDYASFDVLEDSVGLSRRVLEIRIRQILEVGH